MWASDTFASDIIFSTPFNFRDQVSVNPAGTAAGDRDNLGVFITPFGAGTTALATQGATTQALFLIPDTAFPHDYAAGRAWDPSLAGAWLITATDASGSASISTNPIPNPKILPFVQNLKIVGNSTTPKVTWSSPDLTGLGVNREQFRIWDFDRTVIGTRKDILFSMVIPAGTTSFDVPSGVLKLGGHYSLDVVLDNQVTFQDITATENRSETFTGVFSSVPAPASLLLLVAGLAGLAGLTWKPHRCN